ncbi:septal ring lytic transglycosylase RlpA family protein [Halotia wernerae UHCC 0503]|jgi:rare lipoprotein A|nr:septal ring lytic transglycosylase RlpA family protein [Halotia wernerae UHCC 0503]
MRISSFSRAGALLAIMLALGACSQLKLGATAVKSMQGAEPAPEQPARAQGIYKVGDPYQIQGVWYYPAEDWNYVETGIASFYGGERSGTDFHGRLTANGELYDMNSLTAAHTTLPMPSLVRVTNIENGRSIVLRVNDRGPFARGRIIDVSRRAAQLLGFEGQGTARVKVELMADESRQLKLALTGRDENRTFAAVPRTEVASDALPPPPGARASSGPVQSSTLPPPSQMLPGQQNAGNARAPNNARQAPLAQRAAPIQTQAANDPAPAPQAPATAASSRGAPVVNGRNAAPPALASREVAALPVEQQAMARPTLTQTAPRASSLWVQAGAFGNYENAYRLSVRLSRYGSTKVIPASVNGAQIYRVRLGPIADVTEADRVLATLGSEVPEARIVVD